VNEPVSLTGKNLKYKYTIPSAWRGRSYRSSSANGGTGSEKPKMSGAEIALHILEQKASRARNAKIKVTMVLDQGRKIRFERVDL
jgi:hypothetical protein